MSMESCSSLLRGTADLLSCKVQNTMKTLEQVIQNIEQDPRNQSYTERHIPPIFQIHEHARILIVGQAPGRKAEESLIPFHDISGKVLMEWLGMSPEEFYGPDTSIMPMDFYYPGKGRSGDLPPRSFIAETYHADLLALMPEIELTVLIGRYACAYYLKSRQKQNLTETVRNYQEYLPEYFPITHPSPLNQRWRKNHPWFLEETIPALKEQVAFIRQENQKETEGRIKCW